MIAGISLLALVKIDVPRPAVAQLAVVCAGCSQMFTQLLEYAKQAQEVATQLEQYRTQLQQYQNMITNTAALPLQVWSTVESDIARVQQLSRTASLLSGNTGSLIGRLNAANAFIDQAGNLTSTAASLGGQIGGYQRAIGANLNALGKALDIQQSQATDSAALLTALGAHSTSAQGQMQAIQAGNELAHANASVLLQMQETQIATAQMQGTQFAVSADRTATQDAAIAHFIAPAPLPTSGYKEW